MTIRRLLQSPRARRGIAAGAIVLSLGGLVLYRADVSARPIAAVHDFRNGTTFAGPGATGSFSLSHAKILADGRSRVFAELRLRADDVDQAQRAPLSMVIVLDTSGSMDGDKIVEARRSVIEMLDKMSDDDEVALVRYDSNPEVLQPMARVGEVRERLIRKVRDLHATGGTNIPEALRLAMDAVGDASGGRVKRVVLVSDGLDSSRSESEGLARRGTDEGVTVSSLGIGLDFDEAYMAGVAQSGRGNFGFVENGGALARFLERELKETAATTIENARATITLPRYLRFVRAVGADVRQRGDGEVELRLGALHAGDERRVVLELAADAPIDASLDIRASMEWREVGGARADIDLDVLRLAVSDDRRAVNASRDDRVYASSISAIASARQLEAAELYSRGDRDGALAIIGQNSRDLEEAADAAPPEVAGGLLKQKGSYDDAKEQFAQAAPGSAEGRAAAKRETEKDSANLARPAYK
jgi:Ca-activated chloride channel homolog